MSEQLSGDAVVIPKEMFGPILTQIGLALKMLGADSCLQAAVGSWRDTQDDSQTLLMLKDWVQSEGDRIAAVVQAFKDYGFWNPNRAMRRDDRAKSRRTDWQAFLAGPTGSD